jgi:pyrimidine operon attenuation protein / uracil phosphoribosyltransferase
MILTQTIANRKLQRMALEIAENNIAVEELVFVGIKENGLVIAEKLVGYLKPVFGGALKLVSLSLDKKNPSGIHLSEDVNLANRNIVLVDDVANSGKTMLYALAPLLHKKPSKIETAALVERTHKLFPIGLTYVGLSVASTLNEHIIVAVQNNEVTGAFVQNK